MATEVPNATTPEEALEAAYLSIRAGLVSALLGRVRTASPRFFKRPVVELLKMGYGGTGGVGEAIGRSGDEGIDGIIAEDWLGFELVYLQAKRWEGTVGRPEVQKFVGALHGKRAGKGYLLPPEPSLLMRVPTFKTSIRRWHLSTVPSTAHDRFRRWCLTRPNVPQVAEAADEIID